MIPDKIKVGDKFKTNCSGDVVVIDYIHCNNIIVQFEDGQTKSVASGNLRAGKVNNKKAPPKGRSKLGDIILGEIKSSRNYGDFTIVAFEGARNITIKFCNTGTICHVSSQQIREGTVYDPLAKTKCGVGYFGIGKFNSKDNSVEYKAWNSMMTRAYSDEYKEKFPTYVGVSVCEDWHNFQNFAEWCNSQHNFGKKGWVLDKDILKRGNKVYSPEYCRFVHHSINALVVKCDANRGSLPIGVSWCNTKNKYAAHVNKDGKTVFCGYHSNPLSAFSSYKTMKEKIIKEVIGRFKDDLDSDIYSALFNYEVLITD